MGYGAANRTGFLAAKREGFVYAIVMDADGTQEPRFIERFFEPMRHSIDFIKASRYIKGSAVVGVTAQRRLVSWIGNIIARIILRLPLTDYTNGFRAIKTDLACKLITKSVDFRC
ncbi:MAG: glycosyltransferase [Candidatus Obscuribacter sp.]|nr:glycosyltransferase [Candidatus Obscuribacter sp.]